MYQVVVEHKLLSKVRAKAPPIEVDLTSKTTNRRISNTPAATASSIANKKISALMEDVENDNFDV